MEYTELNFAQALGEVLEGKRITRLSWGDKREYGLLADGLLSIHKAGESADTTRPWIINDGDLTGLDWISLSNIKK